MNLGGFPERIGRILFLLLALVALGTITRAGPRPPPPGPGAGTIVATPLAGRDVGALRFLAGWTLTSADLRFGGISGLHIEGGEVSAISDLGMLLRFPLPGSAARIPVVFAPFEQGPGPRVRKSNRDTEGLLIRGRWLWATFERHNMIWRYDRSTLRAASAAQPDAMRRWRSNAGPEAIVRLADGRFLVFAEGKDDGAPTSEAVLFAGDPAVPGTPAVTLRYRRLPGFRVTDAALLPDGRLLILNRRFGWLSGWSARLVVAELRGGEIAGREVAALESPLPVDNMEGLSVTGEGGRTIVWLASDDNFNPLQRTLLLKFEWAD